MIVILSPKNFSPTLTARIVIFFKSASPEKTYEKIEKLLNDRLGYETTNHNAVMGALNPNNEVLLNLVSKDHRELKVLTGETLQHLRMEKAAK